MASKSEREIISSNVARLLKEERERQGVSLNALAKKVGLSQQMVSYVERELRAPTLDTLLRISGGLGISFWKLLREASKAG